MVFLSKTLPRENQKPIFLVSGRIVCLKRLFFLVFLVFPSKKLVFLYLFPRKKLVFLSKTIFFLGKSWFSCPKPFFT